MADEQGTQPTTIYSFRKIFAYTQVALSALFITGYFFILSLFLLGYINTPPTWRDALTALLGVVTAGVMQIIGYWFSRQRENS